MSAAATSRPKLRNRAHLRSAAPCQVSRSSVKLAKLEPGTCQAQSLNLSASSLVVTKPPSTTLVFNCDEQIVNRLFHGPLGNEHFELGIGRNLGVSDSFGSSRHPWDLSIREEGAGVITLQRLQTVNLPYWGRTLFGAEHVPGILYG